MMNVRSVPPIKLLAMKAVLRTQHGGPGPHKDGSSQDVHGGKGAGSTSTSTTAKAGGKGSSKASKAARVTWRDINGETLSADVYKVDEFGALPKNGSAMLALSGPNRGEILFVPSGPDGEGPTHGQTIRATHAGGTVDDYVRFYFTKQGISFSTTSAAQEVTSGDWETPAIDNIYKAMDRLAAAGIPNDFPVEIETSGDLIKTTIK